MKINTEMDCTHLEFLEDLVNEIYSMGGNKRMSLPYFLKSKHPQEIACLSVAENIFEMVIGDRPDYADIEE